MLGPVRVTAETTGPFSLLLPMFGVAALAIGVLRDRVQTLQGRGLMAAPAGWGACGASGAGVGPVAVVALPGQLAMR